MFRKGRGFTLIELLVVIAIIAILAAILFPVFTSAKEKARQVQCVGNMGQLGKALRMYLDNWNGQYPKSAGLGQNPKGSYVALDYDTTVSGKPYCNIYARGGLWPYIKTPKVYVCPSDPWQMLDRTVALSTGYCDKSKRAKREFGLSYSMNNAFGWNVPTANDADVKQPSRTVVFIDEGGGSKGNDGRWNAIVDGNFGPGLDWPTKCHVGGCNYTFADGHAKWYSMRDFSKLNWSVKGWQTYNPPEKALED